MHGNAAEDYANTGRRQEVFVLPASTELLPNLEGCRTGPMIVQRFVFSAGHRITLRGNGDQIKGINGIRAKVRTEGLRATTISATP
jgi:hypothetical protein